MSGAALYDPAPDFELPSSTGQRISLREELTQGPVVLAFYLFDFGRT